jgi:hypothetical protein
MSLRSDLDLGTFVSGMGFAHSRREEALMTRAALPLLLSLLALTTARADVDSEVLIRGEDGKATAGLEELDRPAELEAYGLEAREGRSLVAIHLGEQPRGTEVVVERAWETDRWGLGLKVRLAVAAPAVAKEATRPFLVVSLPRAMDVEHDVRVTLTLGEAVLGPMSLDAADRTRAKLAVLKRSQRRRVEALSLANAELRGQVRQLEAQVLAYQDDPGYEAAVGALPWQARIRRVVEEASFRTDLQLFGTTLNPLWTSGDENLKYVSAKAKRKQQTAEIERGYAEEAERIEAKVAELEDTLAEMQAFAAKHAGAGAADVIAAQAR